MRRSIAEKPFADRNNVSYEQIAEYLSDLFSEHHPQDGYICIRSGPKTSAEQSWLDVDKIESNLKPELFAHDYRDAYFSFSTFQKSKSPSHLEENIQNIFAWSIDVDYKNESANPLNVYDYIMENVSLPAPNYVEYGHRLRMIYIFAEPLRLFQNQREKLLRGFQFMQRSFCKIINEELGFMGESFGAESNPANSFFRIPGSINSKDGSVIKIMHITDERFTLQELFKEWIPNAIIDPSACQEKWIGKWKESALSRKREVFTKRFNTRLLWERRISMFETLRSMEGVHRKKLCFFYMNGLMQLGETDSQKLMRMVHEFNRGFANPLPCNVLNRTLKWMAANGKSYKFSDRRIAEELEIDPKYFSEMSRSEKDAKRYRTLKNEKIRKGETKSQKILLRRKNVSRLLSCGMTLAQIAKEVNASLSTIKRDVVELRCESDRFEIQTENIRRCGEQFMRTLDQILTERKVRLTPDMPKQKTGEAKQEHVPAPVRSIAHIMHALYYARSKTIKVWEPLPDPP